MFSITRKALTTASSLVRGLHTLPELPYSYGALSPVISEEIMTLHHSKHHQTYVDNLNATESKLNEALASGDISAAIALEPAMKFNGGGHINHSIFWTNLSPHGGGVPKGDIKELIERDFSSFDKFKELMTAKTVGIQGSGWGWLGWNPRHGRLRMTKCPNQDPLTTKDVIPLLGIDVWEHAYYLQYKNARANYVKAIWDVINWDNVNERLDAARMQS
ncbi:superoxide dismutase [Mn], mitochondrial-like [Watersipora subatra]|uniref:superoxide dismutase [Mn], mitochondrial-like n=1 Tax=Watersipora subatra TaxID=2589382 RepID=UPI00355B3892